MGYSKNAISGVSWVGLFRVVTRGVALIRTGILARILTPAHFGTFGVASLILSLLEMLTETGINVVLIQEDDEKTLGEYLNTAWVTSIVRGLIVALLIFLSAPLIGSFFNNPAAISLIQLIALVPFIRGFINPALVTFQKHLKFGQEFWFRSTVTLIDSGIAIALAFITRSPISLVGGLLAGALVETILSHLLLSPKPKFTFDPKVWRAIVSRGKWVTLAGIFTYLSNQTPDTVIGKLLSPTGLGFYQMAYRLAMMPVTEITDVFNRVSFPIYVKIVNDRSRALKAYLKNTFIMLSLTAPAALILILFPEFLVQFILGSQWLEIAPLMRFLGLNSFILTLGAPAAPLFLAVKKQHYLTHISVLNFIVVAVLIVPLVVKYNLIGAAYALIIAAIVILPVKYLYTIKVFHALRP